MTLWLLSLALAVFVGFLTHVIIKLENRVDDLETWILPQKGQEKKEQERKRLREAVEQGLRDGIMVPRDVLRETYPNTYPANQKSNPPDGSSV
jgi:hypothetical protein